MVESMTGYGAHTETSDNYKVTVELKSLNSKFIEHNIKIPRSYMKNEVSLRTFLTKKLRRGKISTVLTVEVLNPDKHSLRINQPLVDAYVKQLEAARSSAGIEERPTLEYILSLPDVMMSENGDADPEEWEMIQKSFEAAADDLVKSRLEEGKALLEDMRSSCDEIGKNLAEVKAKLPGRTENIRSRIESTVKELKDNLVHDPNRFEQELIYYIEKLDINEEIVRLDKHIKYFMEMLTNEESNGKRLGFVAQEMGREINTIGSKANDADMQVHVVKMKEELEKIKEQVLNIV